MAGKVLPSGSRTTVRTVKGSTPIRLRAYLISTGTRPVWLAEQVNVSRSHMGGWLSGAQPVPVRHQKAIIEALRRRQLEPVGSDLFYMDQEAGDGS